MGFIVHNPTKTTIRDYPVEDTATKEVRLWSIYPGETLEFPDAVGKYLVDIYGFLQRIVTKEQLKREKEHEEAMLKGKQFTQVKVVDNISRADEVVKAGEDTVQQAESTLSEDAPEKAVIERPRTCKECGAEFATDRALKLHHASIHLKI